MLFAVWLIFGFGAAYIAKSRNANGARWFVLGLLFGPVGLLLAFAAKSETICPFCRSGIHPAAIRCPECQADLPPVAPKPWLILPKTRAGNIAALCLGALIVVILVLGAMESDEQHRHDTNTRADQTRR